MYKLTLDPKNPLSAYSIKKKDSQGDTMLFTSTLSKSVKTITGGLSIKGPNRNVSDTYSVTLK